MNSFLSLIQAHQTIASLIAYFLMSNIVGSMPSPTPASNGFYRWFFGVLTGIMGGIPRLVATLAPNSTIGTYLQNGNKPNGAVSKP